MPPNSLDIIEEEEEEDEEGLDLDWQVLFQGLLMSMSSV